MSCFGTAWGRSILGGHQLTTVERSVAVVGVAMLGLGKLGVFGKIGKLGKILRRAAKGGDEATNVAKAAERAETMIAALNVRGGLTSSNGGVSKTNVFIPLFFLNESCLYPYLSGFYP